MTEKKKSVEATVKNIRQKSRKKYSAEEKIRIVLEGLRGEKTITELCRYEGINQNSYYKWSKEFLEAACHLMANFPGIFQINLYVWDNLVYSGG